MKSNATNMGCVLSTNASKTDKVTMRNFDIADLTSVGDKNGLELNVSYDGASRRCQCLICAVVCRSQAFSHFCFRYLSPLRPRLRPGTSGLPCSEPTRCLHVFGFMELES